METGMTKQELHRVEVLALRRAGKISQAEAGRRLRLSARQVRRLEAKVARYGHAGLRSQRRGRPSNRRLPATLVRAITTLIRSQYRDFGPTLASEYLALRHGITVSKETVRQLMLKAKLWRAHRGPQARLHFLRERRARFGELIQVDGSHHAWFEQRGPRCCLVVFIDDATNRLTALHFVPQECTLGYMAALYQHIRAYGLPMALYSDRHGIFRVNQGARRDDLQSQLGRALTTLGIDSICANSPQAKGRVERVNAVLQDRLIKAMRLAGIDSIAAANAWLPQFVTAHNARFALAPADAADAHVSYHGDHQHLRRVLAKHYPRKLSPSLTCQFHSTVLQVQTARASLRGAAVLIAEHFSGEHELLWHNASLPYRQWQRQRQAPPELGRKQVTDYSRRSTCKPGPHHPWRTTPIGPLSPEFVVR